MYGKSYGQNKVMKMYGYNGKSISFVLGILLLHQVVGLCMHGHIY